MKADVRAHADRVQQRASSRGAAVAVLASTLMALAVYAILVRLGFIAFKWIPFRGPAWLAPIWITLVLAAGAVYWVVRGRRIRRVDAFSAPIAEVLEFLRVTVE